MNDDILPLPQRLHTPTGEVRRVGVEFELAGLDVETIASITQACFGGAIEARGSFNRVVSGTRLGDFGVELDAQLLKDEHYLGLLDGLGVDTGDERLRARINDTVERVAGTLVPHEIVAPPIPVDRLGALEVLREALRRRQAVGTRHSLRYAFGLHLNPEIASGDATDVLAHMRAFILLRDRLYEWGEIDVSRRLMPFIRDYPEAYARLVVNPDYAPDLPTLIADYLGANPTRNRALDLLPLFAHLAPEALPDALREDPLLQARPTYHYRLPNCAIDEPDWTLAREWQGWLAIERLAAQPERLAELGRAYRAVRRQPISGFDHHWAERTGDCVP